MAALWYNGAMADLKEARLATWVQPLRLIHRHKPRCSEFVYRCWIYSGVEESQRVTVLTQHCGMNMYLFPTLEGGYLFGG